MLCVRESCSYWRFSQSYRGINVMLNVSDLARVTRQRLSSLRMSNRTIGSFGSSEMNLIANSMAYN